MAVESQVHEKRHLDSDIFTSGPIPIDLRIGHEKELMLMRSRPFTGRNMTSVFRLGQVLARDLQGDPWRANTFSDSGRSSRRYLVQRLLEGCDDALLRLYASKNDAKGIRNL